MNDVEYVNLKWTYGLVVKAASSGNGRSEQVLNLDCGLGTALHDQLQVECRQHIGQRLKLDAAFAALQL